jgi:transcriptional regulator with XRE-family HTH domain
MSIALHLVDALKTALRKRGRTYAEIATALSVSEATVKRDLSKGTLGLDRFAQICEAVGVSLDELTSHIEARAALTEQLTYDQEQTIVSDPKLWLVSLCVLNHWTFQEIQSRYDITAPDLTRYLLMLDEIGVLELHEENRIRLRLARHFKWRPNGPFIKTFREHLAQEFLRGDFDDKQEFFRLVTASLSPASMQILFDRMKQIASEIATLHIKDQRIPRDTKTTVTAVLAIREWEPKVFRKMLRA